jgi:hypothetical protein
MSACDVCQHPKVQAINVALLSGRHLAVVARQYRLERQVLTRHQLHMTCDHAVQRPMKPTHPTPTEVAGGLFSPFPRSEPETPLAALQPALRHVRRAIALAGTDRDAQQLVMNTLTEVVQAALQHDDMGLP